jgi:hypothetical protein
MILAYFIIGLMYWALNSFIRKLETNGDWMLPLVWLFAWPIAFLTWAVIFIMWIAEEVKAKRFNKHF